MVHTCIYTLAHWMDLDFIEKRGGQLSMAVNLTLGRVSLVPGTWQNGWEMNRQ